MNPTSFLGFACPNLLLLYEPVSFKEPVTFVFARFGTFSGSSIYLFLYLILG